MEEVKAELHTHFPMVGFVTRPQALVVYKEIIVSVILDMRVDIATSEDNQTVLAITTPQRPLRRKLHLEYFTDHEVNAPKKRGWFGGLFG